MFRNPRIFSLHGILLISEFLISVFIMVGLELSQELYDYHRSVFFIENRDKLEHNRSLMRRLRDAEFPENVVFSDRVYWTGFAWGLWTALLSIASMLVLVYSVFKAIPAKRIQWYYFVALILTVIFASLGLTINPWLDSYWCCTHNTDPSCHFNEGAQNTSRPNTTTTRRPLSLRTRSSGETLDLEKFNQFLCANDLDYQLFERFYLFCLAMVDVLLYAVSIFKARLSIREEELTRLGYSPGSIQQIEARLSNRPSPTAAPKISITPSDDGGEGGELPMGKNDKDKLLHPPTDAAAANQLATSLLVKTPTPK